MCPSSENRLPWATLKLRPSSLWTSAVTWPGAVLYWCNSPAMLSLNAKPFGMGDVNSLGLNLKASWEDSLTTFISIKISFPSADMTSHCSTDNHVLDRRVHHLVWIYHAEGSPVTEAFSNITQWLITTKLSEVSPKIILFIFISDVQAFPAFIGIFSTPVKSHL